MSITSAFNGALSGLQAFGKKSELISSNVANATTSGYGTRTLALSSNEVAAGVVLGTVSRTVDPVIIAARRTAESQSMSADVTAGFQSKVLELVGTPDSPNSLGARIAGLEASLIAAASFPEAPARLQTVAMQAADLTDAINRVATGISDARSNADASIARQVSSLNASLQDLETLNIQITTAGTRGLDTSSLKDQRQIVIDRINQIVPIREVARPNDQVALFTEGGAILIDGPPVEFGFTPVNTVTPYQTLQGGQLSGLTMNGQTIDTSNQTSPLKGGTLIAQFTVRDELAPEAQQKIDASARDLIIRFQSSAVDPSLGANDAGLFADVSGAFDPADELGIANRITINPRVDPSTSTEMWRLRSGLEVGAPGAVGDGSLLNAMRDALTRVVPVASGNFGPGALSSPGVFAQLASWAGGQSAVTEQRQSFLSASLNEMRQAELSSGVDTDAELQNLMIVEKAYAANARVLQTVDEMLETLMRIG